MMTENSKAPGKGSDELKAWMVAHPQEYAQFAARMSGQGIAGLIRLGEEAVSHSEAFRKEAERAIASGHLDFDSLLEALSRSGFPAAYFGEKTDERLAMAAWLRYGDAPEMVVNGLDELVVEHRKRRHRSVLSTLRKAIWLRCFQRRASLSEEASPPQAARPEEVAPAEPRDLPGILRSADTAMVRRIGEWALRQSAGIDTARLYVALVETGEMCSRITVTSFAEALRASFPGHPIVGLRQLQKSVNYLQGLSPNRKSRVKDEPDHRFAIDAIKRDILLTGGASAC